MSGKRSMTKFSLFAAIGAVTIAGCVPVSRGPTAPDPARAAPATPSPAPPASPVDGNPVLGGVPMVPTKTIVENASAAPPLTTLVTALTAAGLASTLSGAGPFTVFAPTNEAFGRLAPGTVDMLLKPENKAALTKVLTYHVVTGVITAEQLTARIASGGGAATLTTIEGETLTARMEGGAISLTDVNGTKSYIETPDVRQSNGVIHVVNGVLVPTL